MILHLIHFSEQYLGVLFIKIEKYGRYVFYNISMTFSSKYQSYHFVNKIIFLYIVGCGYTLKVKSESVSMTKVRHFNYIVRLLLIVLCVNI